MSYELSEPNGTHLAPVTPDRHLHRGVEVSPILEAQSATHFKVQAQAYMRAGSDTSLGNLILHMSIRMSSIPTPPLPTFSVVDTLGGTSVAVSARFAATAHVLQEGDRAR